jgi:hypothetical protein
MGFKQYKLQLNQINLATLNTGIDMLPVMDDTGDKLRIHGPPASSVYFPTNYGKMGTKNILSP